MVMPGQTCLDKAREAVDIQMDRKDELQCLVKDAQKLLAPVPTQLVQETLTELEETVQAMLTRLDSLTPVLESLRSNSGQAVALVPHLTEQAAQLEAMFASIDNFSIYVGLVDRAVTLLNDKMSEVEAACSSNQLRKLFTSFLTKTPASLLEPRSWSDLNAAISDIETRKHFA